VAPAVSIILPTFGRLEFLPATIDSVFAQSFTDWELIIADDGSIGETRAFLQKLQESERVQVIWLAHTGRPGAVRNAALRVARGKHVAFLDSDDVWLPTKLATQIASLRRHPSRRWSYTRFSQMDRSGHRRAAGSVRSWPAPSGWILEKLLKEETVIALPSVVVARALLEQSGAFDEELVMCEDDELWLRLATHSEIDGIDAPLTVVRRHDQHAGSDIIAWRDRRRVFEKALRRNDCGSFTPILRKLRAEMAAGLARSQAVSGKRRAAAWTLLSSAPYCWRAPQPWIGALGRTARACVPRAAQSFLRRHLHGQSVQSTVPRS
jgi:glycosyltransferase involved in cell wall biosynthesis